MARRGSAAALLVAAAALLLQCSGAAAAAVAARAAAASGQEAPPLAECPAGYFRITAANDTAKALATGMHAFQWHMQEFCSRMPLFVTDPAAFAMKMLAQCASLDRSAWVVTLAFNTPCAGGARRAFVLNVNWRPPAAECGADYYPNAKLQAKAVQDPKQMQPLVCPPGFVPGRVDVVGNVLDVAFLERVMPTLRGTKHWCPRGIAQISYLKFNGCTVKVGGPSLLAEGQALYKCVNSSVTQHIGFTATGGFWRQCFDKVTLTPL